MAWEARGWQPDARLRVRTPVGRQEFLLALKATALTPAAAETIALEARSAGDLPKIVFARHVPPDVGGLLAEHGLYFVDTAGNCRIGIGRTYLAQIEGRRPPRQPGRGRGLGVSGYRALFAILADPAILDRPVRELARSAGVGKTAIAHLIRRLEEDRLVGSEGGSRRLLAPEALLERWLVGYDTLVRPRLLLGSFRPAGRDPEAVERRIEAALGEDRAWAWGGGAAAARLTDRERGTSLILHADELPAGFADAIDAEPAPDGTLTVVRLPGPLALRGAAPHTAHPLLVCTELLRERTDAARDAAVEIRERFLSRAERKP